jgi:uncharacterized radical SAM superfamily Fe-S cluster-containing enzyme
MFEIENLDIVITRNCQLACKGCLVFSDHKEVKDHFNPHDWKNEIKWWGTKVKPKTLHLFGGEPLMNPWLDDWIKLAKISFKKTINIQTNGILLEKYGRDFLKNPILRISISKHNNNPDYLDKVNSGIELMKSVIDVVNIRQIKSETFYDGRNGTFSVVDWTQRSWVPHYDGHGKSLTPGNTWDSENYIDNHGHCEAKTYIQLYKGKLWKCPTIAVLKDSLKMIGTNTNQWEPWFNYFALEPNSDDDMIESWLTQQRKPERICNMCFGDPRPTEEHFIKIKEIKHV